MDDRVASCVRGVWMLGMTDGCVRRLACCAVVWPVVHKAAHTNSGVTGVTGVR